MGGSSLFAWGVDPAMRWNRSADRDGAPSGGLIASALFHLAFVLAIISLLPVPAQIEPLIPDVIRVNLVPTALQERRRQPDIPDEKARVVPLAPEKASVAPDISRPPPAAPKTDDAPEVRPMIRATQIYAGSVLKTPEARQARLALPTLIDEDRKLQLCGLEAMEQIHAWDDTFQPERLVAYAMEDARIRGSDIVADGAAFRSRGRWYNLRFRCEVTANMRDVVAFEFAVGDPIPYEEWDSHYLAAVH